MGKDGADEFRQKTPYARWDYGVGDIVRNTENIIKVCLFIECSRRSAETQCLVWLVRSPGAQFVAQREGMLDR